MDFLNPSFMRQVRAARALLGWTQQDLSKHSGVSLSTLNRLERNDGDPSINSLRMLYDAFHTANIHFVTTSEGGGGVILGNGCLKPGDGNGSMVGEYILQYGNNIRRL